MLDQGVSTTALDVDFVQFWQAGTPAKGEFSCSECGYGVTVQTKLPACPMCGGRAWEQSPWGPQARAAAFQL